MSDSEFFTRLRAIAKDVESLSEQAACLSERLREATERIGDLGRDAARHHTHPEGVIR